MFVLDVGLDMRMENGPEPETLAGDTSYPVRCGYQSSPLGIIQRRAPEHLSREEIGVGPVDDNQIACPESGQGLARTHHFGLEDGPIVGGIQRAHREGPRDPETPLSEFLLQP